MMNLKTSLFVIFIVICQSNALSMPGSDYEKIEKNIKQIIKKSKLPEESFGIYVATEGKDIFELNAQKKMIPASITKLVTAGAVIQNFQPGYKFKTRLVSTGTINNQILKGDLVLVGGGDPSFVSENMWYLVNIFTRNQVKQIEGDLVVDDSLFDSERFDSSRQKVRVDRAYDSPVGAMSFNWNSVNIFVRPGLKVGDAAEVFIDPENEYITLKSNVVTTKSETSVVADRDENNKGSDVVVVNGKIAINSKELVIYKNITQPDLWTGYNLKEFLKQRGVIVKGKVRPGKANSDAKTLAESEGKSIEGILADMNKFSNNYVAEMLTKGLAAVDKKPGSIEAGMNKIKKYLSLVGVNENEYSLQNPSGLTRDNLMTAKSIWKVLNHLRSQFQFQPEFTTSLPISGIDGTLKNRMKNGPGERSIRAKTGYLNGVVSLAGYAGRKDGSILPFVFIFNGSADESKVRNVFDQIAVTMVETE